MRPEIKFWPQTPEVGDNVILAQLRSDVEGLCCRRQSEEDAPRHGDHVGFLESPGCTAREVPVGFGDCVFLGNH